MQRLVDFDAAMLAQKKNKRLGMGGVPRDSSQQRSCVTHRSSDEGHRTADPRTRARNRDRVVVRSRRLNKYLDALTPLKINYILMEWDADVSAIYMYVSGGDSASELLRL